MAFCGSLNALIQFPSRSFSPEFKGAKKGSCKIPHDNNNVRASTKTNESSCSRGRVTGTCTDRAKWDVNDSAKLYRIEGWGAPYFSINSDGNVCVRPWGSSDGRCNSFYLTPNLGLCVRCHASWVGYDCYLSYTYIVTSIISPFGGNAMWLLVLDWTDWTGSDEIDIMGLIESLQRSNIKLPVVIRFPDIVLHRIQKLQECFDMAIVRYGYQVSPWRFLPFHLIF